MGIAIALLIGLIAGGLIIFLIFNAAIKEVIGRILW